MKKEIAEKWVADLRTNPPQCKSVLYNGRGYCCLGRLCVILGVEFKNQYEINVSYPLYQYLPYRDGNRINTDYSADAVLPEEIQDLAGMHSANGFMHSGNALSDLNDSGKSFSQIADIIEENWEVL